MLQLRDTCVYIVKNNEDIVYIGITEDIDGARKTHVETDQQFTDVVAVTDDLTADQADQICADLMEDYVSSNGGDTPLYNN
ncbi:hypothetical protein KS4_30610 [Poriferisphaera corsica]|uniref:GIY-YIG domain-containing protein n=1 Tax=Poriferisphaera corsica TaxID=2528020 RepID=A0A517YXN4_9BACT|nr:hypothetical protein [Poriferisphaera corsica]QDU34984.1 hypothetical protein KS4_30610 [Poriferisphaera corsica]